MMDISKFMRSGLNKFTGYSACKSPDVLDKEIRQLGVLKMDANENPYGPSPKVKRALSNLDDIQIYPDSCQTELRDELSAYTGVDAEQIVAGSGSDQLIDLIIRLFVNPGDEVVSFTPTFAMYKFFTELSGGEFVPIPRDEEFNVVLDNLSEYLSPKTKLIFIAMPNNPTGTQVSKATVDRLVNTGFPIVVDEAYYEFTGQTFSGELGKASNLMILRTFSKWAGLAGLRIGYGLFPPRVAERLNAIRDPYCVNTAAMIAAKESIRDVEYLQKNVKLIIGERERLFSDLSNLGYIKPYPSSANFILCKIHKRDAFEVQKRLESQGILVRYFNSPLMENTLRFSIGKPEDNDRLVKELQNIGEEKNDGT